VSSWLYLSRLASIKEFAFMKALHEHGFPTPLPIDSCRHGIVMSLVNASPLCQVRELQNAQAVYSDLIDLVVKLAEHGMIHGDFNEFNLMVTEEGEITMIDFPQMVSTSHPHASELFDRDIGCLQDFFNRRFGLTFEGKPDLETDVVKQLDLDKFVRASGFVKKELGEAAEKAFNQVTQAHQFKEGEVEEESSQEEEEK